MPILVQQSISNMAFSTQKSRTANICSQALSLSHFLSNFLLQAFTETFSISHLVLVHTSMPYSELKRSSHGHAATNMQHQKQQKLPKNNSVTPNKFMIDETRSLVGLNYSFDLSLKNSEHSIYK